MNPPLIVNGNESFPKVNDIIVRSSWVPSCSSFVISELEKEEVGTYITVPILAAAAARERSNDLVKNARSKKVDEVVPDSRTA
jgi:hypothetical protein